MLWVLTAADGVLLMGRCVVFEYINGYCLKGVSCDGSP